MWYNKSAVFSLASTVSRTTNKRKGVGKGLLTLWGEFGSGSLSLGGKMSMLPSASLIGKAFAPKAFVNYAQRNDMQTVRRTPGQFIPRDDFHARNRLNNCINLSLDEVYQQLSDHEGGG